MTNNSKNDIVALTDENGVQTNFRLLDSVEYKGREFGILIPLDFAGGNNGCGCSCGDCGSTSAGCGAAVSGSGMTESCCTVDDPDTKDADSKASDSTFAAGSDGDTENIYDENNENDDEYSDMNVEIVILEIVGTGKANGELMLKTVEDESTMNAVFEIYTQQMESDFESDSENDAE
ncbi:MAG: DUF1292 domain-containing protein [Clostridiales bacterium]|nr:DUF1292 domain-containing protein [Clostridiales bacterium]